MNNNFSNDIFQQCRTCMKKIIDTSFFYLDYTPLANTQLTIGQTLYSCIPELDLSIVPNAVMCSKCVDNLLSVFKFKKNCLESEIQINKYIQQVQHTGDLNQFHQSDIKKLDIEVKIEDLEITENFKNEDLVCDSAFNEASERTESFHQLDIKNLYNIEVKIEDLEMMENFKNEDLVRDASAFNEASECTESTEPKYHLELENVDTKYVFFNTYDDYNINYNLSAAEANSDTHNSMREVIEHQDHNYSKNLNKTKTYLDRCGHKAENSVMAPVKGKRIYNKYEGDKKVELERVLQLIKHGTISITKASKQYKISKGTLFNKLKNRHTQKIGRPFVLSEDLEKIVVAHMVKVSDWGFPFNVTDLRYVVGELLNKKGIKVPQFGDTNLPALEWCRRFIKRHKDSLTARYCQNIKLSKANLTAEMIKEYFSNLKNSLSEGDGSTMVSPDRIFNYDENSLADDPGVKKCIFRRGVTDAEHVKDFSKSNITVMVCGSASGNILPPYVVYKSEKIWQTWVEGGPPNTRYNRSRNGWFDALVFADWFKHQFVPHARKIEGRVILIGDNLSSHFSYDVLKTAEENDITFCCLPRNSIHLCQPLDVAFFGPAKEKWRNILDCWKQLLQKKSQTLSKESLPRLLNQLYEEIAPNNHSENLISGYKKCGIYPYNPEQVLTRLPAYEEESKVDADDAELVSGIVVDMLKRLRDGENPVQRRRTKVDVHLGKGITVEDLTSSQMDVKENVSSEKIAKHRKRRRQELFNKGLNSNDETDEDNISIANSDDIPYMDSSDDDLETFLEKEGKKAGRVMH